MKASNILFRCSSLGYLMTEARSKTETISETTKTNLVDIFTSEKYNRFTEISSKYLAKGNDVEEDSITLLSRLTKTFLKKNDEHLKNTHIKGTPDLFLGPEITKAERIRDTKSSWDIFTFNRAKNKPLDTKYYWQGLGYMWLTNAQVCNIDYCLNNTPYHIIEGELRKESFKHDEGNTPNWIELQIISNHVYDFETFQKYYQKRGINPTDENSKYIVAGFVEVSLNERWHSFEFERNEADIIRLAGRIKECREWMDANLFENVEASELLPESIEN